MIEDRSGDDLHRIVLTRGKANALNTELLVALAERVEACSAEPLRGLILTAEGPIFCAGLDLPELATLDRRGIAALFDALYRAMGALFAHPRPTVASINGHAIAGGALLTLACDLRHGAAGNAKWGLNEAQLGLAMPPFATELLRYVLDRRILEPVLFGGALYSTAQAHSMGILDEVVEAVGELEVAAWRAIEERTPSRDAFADIKARLHAPTMRAMAGSRENSAEWVDLWFSDEVQHRIAQAVESLKPRPGS
jgi:enoyl-CoA hydratase